MHPKLNSGVKVGVDVSVNPKQVSSNWSESWSEFGVNLLRGPPGVNPDHKPNIPKEAFLDLSAESSARRRAFSRESSSLSSSSSACLVKVGLTVSEPLKGFVWVSARVLFGMCSGNFGGAGLRGTEVPTGGPQSMWAKLQ